MRRRWVILVVGGPLYVAALVVLATICLGVIADPPFVQTSLVDWLAESIDVLTDEDWLVPASIGALAITATQVLFLLPVFRLRAPQGGRSRPLVVSLGLGAMVAAVLTTGALVGLSELVASLVTGRFAESPWGDGGDFLDHWWVSLLVVVLLLASWGFWSALLLVFSRELWADRALGRLVGLLLGGTILELLVIVPVDVMVRRRTDCYCATGTFYSLSLAAAGILWLAGPGVYFALTSRRRRAWRRDWCARCGQAKGPSPGARCPECGYQWRAAGGVSSSAGAEPGAEAAKGD
ncbi:MAG: hypothetical protein ACYTGG_03935 [Planctomycetota bacterium]